MALLTSPDVVVVGAGFAGLSAAVRLTTRGMRVLVVEGRSRLGGRATAFADAVTGEFVDNGQHVLMGCYTATLAFLQDIGALGHVRMQPTLSVTMIDRTGKRSRLACPPLPAPWHLLAGVIEWEALDWADRLSLLRMTTPLKLARDPHRLAASPGETVETWLVRHGQTERLREMLWRPLALAALNQPAAHAGAAPFARVLAEMFTGETAAASIVLPTKPLDKMYAEPAREFIEARGGEVRTGATATIRLSGARVTDVEAGGQHWLPRAVIAAVPWFAIHSLFDGRLDAIADIVERAGRMASSPIATVNLWFDRPVLDEPFVGLPGRVMQWVFDKRTVFGESSSHLSLVSSGADAIVGLPNDQLIALAHAELLESLPPVRGARLLRSTVVRERQATFSLAPGQPARPATETPVGGLFLAGDWIDTGLPATIESAVRSGHRAADAVSREFGQLVAATPGR
ncbi:MAG: hydroxysqualene dehydroxylase HpnE [Acidobacteriota bacterium]